MAKKAKHAPGPWRTIGEEVWADSGRVCVCGGGPSGLGRQRQNHNGPSETQLANAALVSAAPELLELLRETSDAIPEQGVPYRGTAADRKLRERIEKLLARAEGK